MRSIIVITGPTASGKTDIALKLAREINGVIVNADSRQIYKELNIGTAKPSKSEMGNIPHYLYDYVSVEDSYSIYQYQRDVLSLLEKIPEDKPIILVGGTGLYIDSVIYDYDLTPKDSNKDQRETLSQLSIEQLQAQISPEILERLNDSDRHNPRRLIRIIERAGEIKVDNTSPIYPCKYFVIDVPKEILVEKVKARVDQMFENGLEKEARDLFEKGCYQYSALQSIGYQEFLPYFQEPDTYSLESVKDTIVTNTLKYIKRQKTWFRRNKEVVWVKGLEDIFQNIDHA